jgi:hypothetical protein
LIEGGPPIPYRHCPFSGCGFQAHKNQLHRRLVIRKRLAVFDDFLNRVIDRLRGNFVSRALVVYIAFLISGANLKNGITSFHRLRHDFAIIGYVVSQIPANSSMATEAHSTDGERYIFFH